MDKDLKKRKNLTFKPSQFINYNKNVDFNNLFTR